MSIKLPRYTSKDYLVLGVILVPITIIINGVILGNRYWSGLSVFLFTTVVTAIGFAIFFVGCGLMAVMFKKRLPKEEQVGTRLTVMILTFITGSALFLLALSRGYEAIPFIDHSFSTEHYTWAFIILAILNIFITLLHEGIARYENWKNNLVETESLKKVYHQGRLIGLKSQVNPHFLFNSLNCLSCLIQEDQDKGERFLDELTKVYRYMLQYNEEQVVTLSTELRFIDSYFYLLHARHGDALKIVMDISDEDRERSIPPLALQTIIENITTLNSASKEHPLEISIYSEEEGVIAVSHSIQLRNAPEAQEVQKGLDNLARKYEILGLPRMLIHSSNNQRIIRLPLMGKEEVMV